MTSSRHLRSFAAKRADAIVGFILLLLVAATYWSGGGASSAFTAVASLVAFGIQLGFVLSALSLISDMVGKRPVRATLRRVVAFGIGLLIAAVAAPFAFGKATEFAVLFGIAMFVFTKFRDR